MKWKRNRRKIPTPRPLSDAARLQFSFKHLDADHPKFSLLRCNEEFFRSLLLTIKKYSEYTEEMFTDENNKEHRHKNFWDDTDEPDGFGHLDRAIQTEYSWQFALDSSNGDNSWRVHGMLADNVFYIVWLDPLHQLGAKKSRDVSTRKSTGAK